MAFWPVATVWLRPVTTLPVTGGIVGTKGFSICVSWAALTVKVCVALVFVLGSDAVTVIVAVSPGAAFEASMWTTPSGFVDESVALLIVIGFVGVVPEGSVALTGFNAIFVMSSMRFWPDTTCAKIVKPKLRNEGVALGFD